MLRLSGVGVSHIGLVRPQNEDSAFVGPSCMLVADGVGGAAAGEVASATTAFVLQAQVQAHLQAHDRGRLRNRSVGSLEQALRNAVRMAQEQVRHGVEIDPARHGMATTLTALATDGEQVVMAHLGDSRGYVFRRGGLTRVTTDHTFVQQLVDDGSLSESEVARHPWRNVVLRSVDGHPDVEADVRRLPLIAGDRVLLCSDGLTDLVGELQIEEVLGRHCDDAAVHVLLDAALAAGGRDNITVVLATLVECAEPELTAGPAAQLAGGEAFGALLDPWNVVAPDAIGMSHTA